MLRPTVESQIGQKNLNLETEPDMPFLRSCPEQKLARASAPTV